MRPSSAVRTPLAFPVHVSRSEAVMVAVGFSPRSEPEKESVAERRLKVRTNPKEFQTSRRDMDPIFTAPWAEAHGYPHAVAPRPMRLAANSKSPIPNSKQTPNLKLQIPIHAPGRVCSGFGV